MKKKNKRLLLASPGWGSKVQVYPPDNIRINTNSINFSEVMAICKLGKDIFSDDPGKQKMFIFSDIARGFQGRGGNKPDEGEKPIS